MKDKPDQYNQLSEEWASQQPFDDGNSRYTQGLEFQYFQPSQSFRLEDLRGKQDQHEMRLRQLRARRMKTKPLTSSSLPPLTTIVTGKPGGKKAAVIEAEVPVEGVSVDAPSEEASPADAKKKAASVSRAALLLTTASFLARFLGLFRTSLFSHLGTNQFTDAYNLAFNLPDLVYNIVAGGALLSAFIPVFNLYMAGKRDEKAAWHVTSSALNISTAFLILLATIGMIFTSPIVHLYYFNTPSAELDTVASLMRVMFLQSVVMGAGVIVSSVLNAEGDFFLPALGSVLYPVGMIVGLIPSFFIKQVGVAAQVQTVNYASWGVVLGAVLMVGVQIPGLWKIGMQYSLAFDWRHPGVRQIVRQMLPRMLNSLMITMSQYSDFVLIGFLVAFVQSDGLVTQYRYAFTVVTIPLGVITPLATASFPRMSEYVAQGRLADLRRLIIESLQSVLFIALPACTGLVLLSLPIVQVLFEHGYFTLGEAQSTAVPLVCYALGLPGLALVEILTRPFYAMRKSKLPVYISLMQLGLKITLSLTLLTPAVWFVQVGVAKLFPSVLTPMMLSGAWGMGALAMATTLSSLLEALSLLWVLRGQLGGLHLRSLLSFTLRVLLAVLALSVAVAVSNLLLGFVLKTPDTDPRSSLTTLNVVLVVIRLIISIALGSFAYLRASRFLRLLGGEELRPVNRLLARMHLSWI